MVDSRLLWFQPISWLVLFSKLQHELSLYLVDQQGWDGQLTTLRELWLLKLCCVSDDSLVREVGSWQIVSEDAQLGTVEITTLGQAPMQEVVAAWHTGRTVHEAEQTFSSTAIRSFNSSISTRQFVITATLSFPTQARSSADVQAGFRILSSAHEHTAIYYGKILHMSDWYLADIVDHNRLCD